MASKRCGKRFPQWDVNTKSSQPDIESADRQITIQRSNANLGRLNGLFSAVYLYVSLRDVTNTQKGAASIFHVANRIPEMKANNVTGSFGDDDVAIRYRARAARKYC